MEDKRLNIGSLKQYRGFTGTIEYDAEMKSYYGQIENIYDDVSYKAKNIIELHNQFKNAVDWYLNSGLAN